MDMGQKLGVERLTEAIVYDWAGQGTVYVRGLSFPSCRVKGEEPSEQSDRSGDGRNLFAGRLSRRAVGFASSKPSDRPA